MKVKVKLSLADLTAQEALFLLNVPCELSYTDKINISSRKDKINACAQRLPPPPTTDIES